MKGFSSGLWFVLINKSFGIYVQDGGCYQEYPINAGSNYSSHYNTADSCRHNCSAENFTYAAVHNGTQCFCHNQEPPVQNIRPNTFCNVSCPGHVKFLKKTICGGEYRFNTYRTLEESGCYSDPGPGNNSTTPPEPWLLNDTSTIKNETALTIERCINRCSKLNFQFAGVETSAYCYCGNHQPPFSKLFIKESGTQMCNFPCTGNGNEMCGGMEATNIYSTNKIIDEGCYYHRPFHWILDGNQTDLSTSASLYNCQYYCSESGYKYAGIKFHYCYCGNNTPPIGHLRPLDICNNTCLGDGRSECGGVLAIRIVKTLITGGCYPAINKSMIVRKYNYVSNSIEFCVNKCKTDKKPYAGIQKGSVCLCFDDPPKLAGLSYGHCNETCPGNEDEICGGNNHMNVFQVHLKACRTIEDGPNKNTLCKFPFMYKGVEHQTCIRNSKEETAFCGIKYNATVNDLGICNENDCPILLVDDRLVWIVSSVGLTIILCIVLGSIIYAIQKRNWRIAKINSLLLADGRKPSLSLPWNNQINMLSYDTKFEIDKEEILMQEKIGDGQFGTVHKGILKSENGSKEIEVAIKRVKDISDENQLTAIIGELKILSHIETHLNLVNLIGACTKDDVCILLEFCPMGDLKNFITNNRSEFIFNMRNTGDIISSESYVDPQSPLQSTLLLKWCHSIAKGMEYLESKNIMHGDLAIRNILLTKDYVAKIGDFGLSKEIFYGEEYMKKNRRLIPWAWMAIEYLQTGKFSLKSDVWSFGVVMWEIYTLGNKPYDMQPYEEVRPKLTDGYRLPEPDYMEQLDPSEDIYSGVILPCWTENSAKRPNFRKIVSMLENKMAKKELDAYVNMKEYFELTHDVKTKHNTMVCNTEEDTFERKGIETERTKLIDSPDYRNYHGTFASTSGYANKLIQEDDLCNDWKEVAISDQESSQEEEEVQEKEKHDNDYFNIINDDKNLINNEEFQEDSSHKEKGYGEYISLLDT